MYVYVYALHYPIPTTYNLPNYLPTFITIIIIIMITIIDII